ncbi:unnamed protein product, partial [Rotaria sp. Silwood2]
DLNARQQRNWRNATRKIEKNEKLRAQYPAFEPSSDINIIHIHYKSNLDTLNELIVKAQQTKRYTLDTEGAKNKKHEKGALIQIQFIHSINYSTIIIIETNYLPDRHTILYEKIKELWSTIFSNYNEIITWGPIEDEFKEFLHLDFNHIGKNIEDTDLQSLFRSWYNEQQKTHPEMEKRDDDGTDDDEELDSTTYDDATVWSLQKAIEVIFKKFLDKSLTVNWWQCGLDLKLNTWKNQLFSRHNYDERKEKQERFKMVQYAINDCTSVAELYFHMYPGKSDDQQTPQVRPATTRTITLKTPAITSTNITNILEDKLSDISEDEVIELLKPKFNKKEDAPHQSNYEQGELIITTTEQEMNEFDSNEQQLQQQSSTTQTTTTTVSKSERQRRKNMKLKWKQQNRPDFQNKLKRPIYYKYDFRKTRAQLRDDNIHTSHQITINRKYNEVIIGFKSRQELEHAK